MGFSMFTIVNISAIQERITTKISLNSNSTLYGWVNADNNILISNTTTFDSDHTVVINSIDYKNIKLCILKSDDDICDINFEKSSIVITEIEI